MVVQHNISALNSWRNTKINNNGTAKNLEKLSSGFRINRAGDDAAGLAISEKMRGQIRGLNMAEMNVTHGIKLIQTAEGGLNETHSILQRMRELAVQSANGTYQDDVDRENINKEYQALKSEIDRISTSTHYNGIELLDGSLGKTKIGYPTPAGGMWDMFAVLGIDTFTLDASASATPPTTGSFNGAITYSYDGTAAWGKMELDNGEVLQGTWNPVHTDFGELEFVSSNGMLFGVRFRYADAIELDNARIVIEKGDYSWDGTVNSLQPTIDIYEVIPYLPALVGGDGLTFQIGANGGADQQTTLYVENMGSNFIGKTENGKLVSVESSSVLTRDKANDAISVVDGAINMVSGTRADLGAMQNRLEHTLNGLGVTKENLQASESSIRDVDMAKEMMEFTKNNILAQASQSMLAQANQLPQGVLSLLR